MSGIEVSNALPASAGRWRGGGGRLRFARTRRGRVGIVIVVVVVGLALFGPFFAPHAPTVFVGEPGSGPTGAAPLGTDYLGRDVLSRVLWGGRSVLAMSVAATAIAFSLGISIGLTAGYSKRLADTLLMRAVDVILAFPPLLFFLLVATSFGTSELTVVIGVAIVQAPGVARIVYSATREISVRGYVEAAVARGERTRAVLGREILPNILTPLIANLGLYFTYSILLIAAVTFLNLGLQPPAANWALMVSENRSILSIDVWATLAPAGLIAALTIGVNLVGDAVSQSLGRTDVGG